MPKRTSTLAKLSRPRLHDTVPREGLFDRLDALAAVPVTLVSAPPGAGKTTLVASYLESRKLGGIWFQADTGDADPATFFYYLGMAEAEMRTGRARRSRLPLLTPEYLADLPGFARRYFRELFARLPESSALVLDNFQEIGDEGPLHQAIVGALEEVPRGVRVFLVSRHPLPDVYARLTANRAVGLLGWDEIRLTVEEARGLLEAGHAPVGDEWVRRLHEQSGGWAAGLVLLAEQARRGLAVCPVAAPDSLTQVFAYFADQILQRAPAEERRLLVQMSYLPDISARLARELTGSDAAAALLERLYRRHLFTDLRRGDEPRYAFHALFRAFLRHRAPVELSPAECIDTARRAGALMEANAEPDAAMPLYLVAGDLAAAESLIRRSAAPLIGQGRWKVVIDWIEALPRGRVTGSAWLQYWLGTARMGVDPIGARRTLEDAHAVAASCGDMECVVLSAAGVVDSYFLEYADFTPLSAWIAELDRMHVPGFHFGDLERELSAQSAMLIACTYRDPGHPRIDRCATRVRELLGTGIDVNLRVGAGSHLALYAAFTDHIEEGLRASRTMLPLLSDPGVHVFRRAFGWAVLCWYACCAADHDLGAQAIEAMERIATDDGMHIAERFACVLGYFLDMDRGDADSGWRRIERFEAIMDPAQPYEAASLVNMKSWHGLHTGDAALTCRHAGEAVRLFEAAGSIPHTVNAYNGYLWGCAETGDEAAARRAIAVLRGFTAVPNMAWGRWCADAAEALFALRTGDETTLAERLARLFERDWQRRDQYGHQLGWARKWAAALVVAALERGIAVGNARRFARNFALDAPGPLVLDWPWPVRITTLGRFSVDVNGEPIAFPGRAPHKTLALLKALVALGSQDVKDYLLIDALWPDADGDQARDAFRVTLHRLRKLLGQSDAVVVADGCLSLDARICWVDTLALDTALQMQDQAGLVTTLYRGEFLPADRDEPWTLSTRERLKQRFARYVGDRGDRLERAGLVDEATALYSGAIDADAQQELFYLGLVRCHRAAGRDAQARAVLEQLHRTQTAAGPQVSARARETT